MVSYPRVDSEPFRIIGNKIRFVVFSSILRPTLPHHPCFCIAGASLLPSFYTLSEPRYSDLYPSPLTILAPSPSPRFRISLIIKANLIALLVWNPMENNSNILFKPSGPSPVKKKEGVWLVYSTTTVLQCRYARARFSTGLPLSKLNLTPHSPDSAPLLAEPPDFLPSQRLRFIMCSIRSALFTWNPMERLS
jgi:hypothetical protein